jgi:hypothetical protein
MKQKAPDELGRIERHDFGLIAVGVILPQKSRLAACNRQNPAVRDGDPMRVAGQILQNLLRSAEWRFDVNDPFDAPCPAEQGRNGAGLARPAISPWNFGLPCSNASLR